ncbi:hypothetical protein K0M31_005583 [Melipona bicolor]|uniref:Uncharacterized protein n=1 Tax=Melipona bicolor TaxID=60889 RepID=A0AA40FVC7_9HYME|nr:hypothetical protein K0M31_005583 [Melipona bicolor]
MKGNSKDSLDTFASHLGKNPIETELLVRGRAAFPYSILLNCRGPFESDLGNNGEKREEGVQGAKKETGVATVAADKIATEQKELAAHKCLGGSCGSRMRK